MNALYDDFLKSKRLTMAVTGFDVEEAAINPTLFPFQRAVVSWALQLGKAALFEECGLGKTAQELEWSKHVAAHTGLPVLNLAPLAVGAQTVREGRKFGIDVVYVHDQAEADAVVSGTATRIVVTNYERLHLFDASKFGGVVLDESSILKNFTGKTKRQLLTMFALTPYKLCGTATPAPNDYLELGNHAEFLNVMGSNEMISRWFINDTMEAGSYRLKGHAAKDFWRWVTSWAVCLSKPSDLGASYDVPGFDLPELRVHEHLVSTSAATMSRVNAEGRLLPDSAPSATTLHKVKRESLKERVAETLRIVEGFAPTEPVVIWCDTNYEADALVAALPDALEVRGDHSAATKEERLTAFSEGRARIMISKPEIAGYGLNWQHCARHILSSVSYSFEKTYQALRRSWRYGQTRPVDAYMIYSFSEGDIMTTLKAKQAEHAEMQAAMNEALEAHGLFRSDAPRALTRTPFAQASGATWTLYQGDCVPVTATLPDNSIDFGVHSPPFANLYIYSDADADMGNSADNAEFFAHYDFLIREMHRITKPGRLCAVHCKDLPLYMNRDGAAGLYDFPGDIRAHFEAAGWVYHSRVTIWKDPVIEMQRTKNHGLLYKNFRTQAEACRQGMPDYLLVFRKWPLEGGTHVVQEDFRDVGDYIGTEPPEPARYLNAKDARYEHNLMVWQRYASPVWFDIDQTNVLNYELAKGAQDEKHICPLQMDVIERSITLWTNPGETVFTPFAGIGSELVGAIRHGRKAIGVELKPEYFRHAVRHCENAEIKASQRTLFDLMPEAAHGD